MEEEGSVSSNETEAEVEAFQEHDDETADCGTETDIPHIGPISTR